MIQDINSANGIYTIKVKENDNIFCNFSEKVIEAQRNMDGVFRTPDGKLWTAKLIKRVNIETTKRVVSYGIEFLSGYSEINRQKVYLEYKFYRKN